MVLVQHFCKEAGAPHLSVDSSAIGILFSIAQTPTEVKHMTRILCKLYGKTKEKTTIHAKDMLALFTSPSFSLCSDLLRSYITKDRNKMIEYFLEIWTTGISYEDFLHELTYAVHQLGVLSPKINQMIHQLILKGWISFAQGKTHSLDIMRLFFNDMQQGG